MLTITLSEDELSTISNALAAVAEVYRKDAGACATEGLDRLQLQFEIQRKQCLVLLDRLDNLGDFVHGQSKVMLCADEEMQPRTFTYNESSGDYTCTHCGWMQVSPEAGAAELCNLATWHSLAKYKDYAEIARKGGFIVPDQPPYKGEPFCENT